MLEPYSEPHTSPSPATIASGCPLNLQRYTTQNAPTPSIQTFPPDANARPRKRTTSNNIPHTGPSQTQHHPTTTMPADPPQGNVISTSQTPRSLHYSQRSFNLTKSSHDSVGSMSTPSPNPPQTTANECLSELAPISQLAALPQNQPVKRARQTQYAPPHTTKKRKSGQIVSQQHLLNTQNLFPPIKQPTNSQLNKRKTRSHTACHSYPETQTLTQIATASIPQDNTNPFTQQMSNINPTYRIHNDPTYENTDYIEPQTPKKKKMQAL